MRVEAALSLLKKHNQSFENLYKGQPAFSMIIFLNKKIQRFYLFYVNYGHEGKGFSLKKKNWEVWVCRAVVS